MRPSLWICSYCEMIGEETEAAQHMQDHGHKVEPITQDKSDAIRAIWADEQAQRVASLLSYARLRRLRPQRGVVGGHHDHICPKCGAEEQIGGGCAACRSCPAEN